MISTKKEFTRLRRAITNEGLARTIVYKDRIAFAGDSKLAAYARVEEVPIVIVMCKDKRQSYKDLILTLAHEYGHVIDYVRWGTGKRWRTFLRASSFPERTITCAMYVKRAILKTEFCADRYVRTCLKKFDVQVEYDDFEIDLAAYMNILVYKYEVMYGQRPTDKLRQQWITFYEHHHHPITAVWAYNLDKFKL